MDNELKENLRWAVMELECNGLFAHAAAVKYAAAVCDGGGDRVPLMRAFKNALEAENRPIRVVRHTS